MQKRFQALHAPEQGRLLLVGVGVGELEKALAAAVAVVGAGQLTLVGQGNQDGAAVSLAGDLGDKPLLAQLVHRHAGGGAGHFQESGQVADGDPSLRGLGDPLQNAEFAGAEGQASVVGEGPLFRLQDALVELLKKVVELCRKACHGVPPESDYIS